MSRVHIEQEQERVNGRSLVQVVLGSLLVLATTVGVVFVLLGDESRPQKAAVLQNESPKTQARNQSEVISVPFDAARARGHREQRDDFGWVDPERRIARVPLDVAVSISSKHPEDLLAEGAGGAAAQSDQAEGVSHE